MTACDWSNALLGLLMIGVPLVIAVYLSPKAKRALAIRLLASADADEYRAQYYASRVRALRQECKGPTNPGGIA